MENLKVKDVVAREVIAISQDASVGRGRSVFRKGDPWIN